MCEKRKIKAKKKNKENKNPKNPKKLTVAKSKGERKRENVKESKHQQTKGNWPYPLSPSTHCNKKTPKIASESFASTPNYLLLTQSYRSQIKRAQAIVIYSYNQQ